MKKIYKNWILSHKIDYGKIFSQGENILIETNFARGEINFYELEVQIVEMSVTNLEDEETKFYLYFELKDLSHAEELFKEMLEVLESFKKQSKIKILLCCTSGLNTNFFKDRLNETSKFLSLNYEFEAVSFSKLYATTYDYSIILLAPQIYFQFDSVKENLSDKLVLKVPAKIFAIYDIDELSYRCKKIDIVGIAIHGGIHDGYVDLDDRMIDPKINFKKLLEEKYKFSVIIHNNSGEIKFLVRSQIENNEHREHFCNDAERILEIICFEIRAAISIADPELICVRSEMTPDLEKIREKLKKFVPEEFLPKFIYITDAEMSEYILLGQMILCLEALEK